MDLLPVEGQALEGKRADFLVDGWWDWVCAERLTPQGPYQTPGWGAIVRRCRKNLRELSEVIDVDIDRRVRERPRWHKQMDVRPSYERRYGPVVFLKER
jgi:hypothetical protein